jgi:hypothetical protein
LRTLEKLCSLQHDFFSGLQVTLEETRARANYEVIGSLHDHEEIDWGRFGRLRRQWEKKYEDPNDIPVEAARLKSHARNPPGANALSIADNEISSKIGYLASTHFPGGRPLPKRATDGLTGCGGATASSSSNVIVRSIAAF